MQKFFSDGDRLIFICATGIIIRTLAPVLRDKYTDPAVLALDEEGQFVIPLISGHEGGANEWARQVADGIQAQVVSTTANSYQKPVYTVGIGCERNCPVEYLDTLLHECLEAVSLSATDIHSFNSIAIKSDEIAMQKISEQYGRPFSTWNTDQLGSVEHKLVHRSQYVFDAVGVYGVAESAALYAAQQQEPGKDLNKTELILPKQKNSKATCAIARVYLK